MTREEAIEVLENGDFWDYVAGLSCDTDAVTKFHAALDIAIAALSAEKDGRVVVLPCKVGDTVYEANKHGFISTYRVISIYISDRSVLFGSGLIDGVPSNATGFEISALGKTVFLTREEAEAALKKMEEADNEPLDN